MSVSWRVATGWALAGAAVLLALYLLSGILLPFIVGMAAAYLLDPLADWLQRRGFRRGTATLLITALFFALLALLVLVLLPVAIEQAVGLGAKLPGYFDELRGRLLQLVERLESQNVVEGGSVEGLASRFAQQALSYVGTALTNVVQSSLVVLNLFSLVFITPIVTFYLLRDWDRMVAAVRSIVPPRHHPTARRLAKEVDQVLAGFLRGQGMVCLFLACSMPGPDAGRAGLRRHHRPAHRPVLVHPLCRHAGRRGRRPDRGRVPVRCHRPGGHGGAVFALGQFIEGNFLTPTGGRQPHPPARGLGDLRRARRHRPVRPAGTFLATPVAAVIAVLVRFALERWRRSDYFREDTSLPITRLPPPGAAPPRS